MQPKLLGGTYCHYRNTLKLIGQATAGGYEAASDCWTLETMTQNYRLEIVRQFRAILLTIDHLYARCGAR